MLWRVEGNGPDRGGYRSIIADSGLIWFLRTCGGTTGTYLDRQGNAQDLLAAKFHCRPELLSAVSWKGLSLQQQPAGSRASPMDVYLQLPRTVQSRTSKQRMRDALL
jgi:hypothetical protein